MTSKPWGALPTGVAEYGSTCDPFATVDDDGTIVEHHRAIAEEAGRSMESTIEALGKPAEKRNAHGNPAQLIVDAAACPIPVVSLVELRH